MQPYRIKILDDDFLVFSSAGVDEKYARQENISTVIINPSVESDFEIKALDKHGRTSGDVLTPTVAATLFLTERRGLPLTEFSFKTAGGNVEVFDTGSHNLSVKLPKCKFLCTKTETVKGCDATYNDIDVGGTFRTISVENVGKFDRELLSLLILSGERLPSSVIASSFQNGVLSLRSLSDFSVTKPFSLTEYVAAAYNEHVISKFRQRSFPISNGGLTVDINCDFITLRFDS